MPLDHLAICNQAIGTLRRRGVCQWIEREELIAEGCLALIQAQVTDEALGVVVARRAMITAVRRNEVRQRGRETVPAVRDDEAPAGDPWDVLMYSGARMAPIGRDVELWEFIRALPARQYQAVMLTFWGGLTLSQAAGEMGISFGRVFQILNDAKKNIRVALQNRNSRAMTLVGKEISGS